MRLEILAVLVALMAGGIASAGAFAVPRSDTRVDGELRLPDAGCPAARFVVRDGETLRVRHAPSGRAYGFVLALDEHDPGRAVWVAVELEDVDSIERARLAAVPRSTRIGLLESFELPAADGRAATMRFELQLLGLNGAVDLDHGQSTGAGTGEECCVSCDDWTVCGSCVDLWCGSCCGTGSGASDIAPANGGRRP